MNKSPLTPPRIQGATINPSKGFIMEQMVIYRPGDVNIQTTVTNGFCDYTGEYVRGKGFINAQTPEEFIKTLEPGYKCLPWDDALAQIEAAESEVYLTPWEEITEAEWATALETLPPEKWLTVEGINIFRMAEYDHGNITTHYARVNNRYFVAQRRITAEYSDLATEIKER